MFPKLLETRSPWPVVAVAVVLLVGLLSLVNAMYWIVNYLERPSDHALSRFVVAGSVLLVTALVWAGLSVAQRNKARRFDPNEVEDQQARIAKGRSRAVTRAEFETLQTANQGATPRDSLT